MSSEWKEHSLSHLCELIADCPHATPKWTEDGIIVLRNQNIKNGRLDLSEPSYTDEEHYRGRIRRANPQAGDLVITREAPMGEVCQIPEGLQCCLGQRQVLLRADSQKIDRNFLLYAFQSPYLQQQIGWNEGTGSTVSNLRIPVLQALKVPTPNLSMQQQIAEILGSLDDRIALLRETNATLESIAQAIFKSWFIDFDPVKARQQGLEPQGMDAATAALFPDAFQDSELGPIPAGWEVAKLEDVYDINPSRKLKKGEIAPYLGMSSVPTSGHSVGEVIDREMASGTKFINGDTLLARITPCLENGKTAYVDFLDDEQVGWGSTEFIVLKPKAPFASYHAYLLCRDSSFRTFAIQSMSGTSGRQRVQNDVLGSYRLVLPSEEILTAFSDIIEPIQMAMTSNHKRSQTLTSIRDALLPRLISGRLRLPEAGAMAVEVGL